MATRTFKVSLSLDNPRIIQSGINVRSFDKQSIKISIELTKDSQVYQIPTDAQIKISLLKLARQEQKIILDVPNTNRDSIDWIVPEYLDGYRGEVRVGVYLIVGAENIDVGYFNITSSVSDIDSAAEEFTESVLQGWAIEDLTALLPKFQAVLDETTGKDVISAPEIILARDGEVDLKTRLDKEHQEVTAQLAQKANQLDVFLKTKGININDFDEPTRQAFLDLNGIDVNYVLGEGNVKPENTNFLETKSTNLYDSSNAVNGYISTTGTFVADDTFRLSDFINVIEGQTYSTNSNAPGAYYDANKVYVQRIPYDETKPLVVPAGLSIKYMRVAFNNATEISTARVYEGNTLFSYIPYNPKYILDTKVRIVKDNLNDEKLVDAVNCTFITQKPELNLFNKTTAVDGYIPTGDGTLIPYAGWASTDYIEVEEGKTYTQNGGANSVVFYDVNKTLISRIYSSSFAIPTNGKYVRLAIYKTEKTLDQYMVVEGTQLPQTYAPYNAVDTIVGIRVPTPSPVQTNKWANKKVDVLGDSITNMQLWQPHVATALGTQTFINHGIGGSRISGTLEANNAMWTDARVNSLTTDSDLYLIMGGTNDWADNTPMGTGDTMDTNTFIGAYRVLLDKMVAKFPSKRIVIMTTPFGTVPNRVGWTDTLGITNNNGFTTRDYAQACRQVAGEYGIPIIDIDAESYFNKINLLQFVTDETIMRVHPQETGAKRIAEIVIGRLKALEPIA